MSDLNSILNISTESSTQKKNCVFCQKAIPVETKFCPFCKGDQNTMPTAKPDFSQTNQDVKNNSQTANMNFRNMTPGVFNAIENSQTPFIEFRASDNVWNIEEREPPVKPEQRRPALIIDEETILFAQTDKHLSPEQLLARVQAILKAQNVPVEATLTAARWVNDFYEVRPRIVASLKDHTFSGLKMILGLDYMGSWASLQYQIGLQPDPFPQPPPSVINSNAALPVLLGIGGAFFSLVGLVMAANGRGGDSAFGVLLLLGGIAAVIGAVIWYMQMQQQVDMQQKERERYLREQYEMRNYKARMQLSRTYKIDDMKLFQTAMRVVFQTVVDDIVQSGGEIVKEVKGGRSEFYAGQTAAPNQQNQPMPQAQQSSPQNQSNASQVGV